MKPSKVVCEVAVITPAITGVGWHEIQAKEDRDLKGIQDVKYRNRQSKEALKCRRILLLVCPRKTLNRNYWETNPYIRIKFDNTAQVKLPQLCLIETSKRKM